MWSHGTENLTVADVTGLFISPKKKFRCQSSSLRIQAAFVFLFHCPYHVACILITANHSLHLQPHIHVADRSQGKAQSGGAHISKRDTSPENPGRLFILLMWLGHLTCCHLELLLRKEKRMDVREESRNVWIICNHRMPREIMLQIYATDKEQ